jgi:hypothetical protein
MLSQAFSSPLDRPQMQLIATDIVGTAPIAAASMPIRTQSMELLLIKRPLYMHLRFLSAKEFGESFLESKFVSRRTRQLSRTSQVVVSSHISPEDPHSGGLSSSEAVTVGGSNIVSKLLVMVCYPMPLPFPRYEQAIPTSIGTVLISFKIIHPSQIIHERLLREVFLGHNIYPWF